VKVIEQRGVVFFENLNLSMQIQMEAFCRRLYFKDMPKAEFLICLCKFEILVLQHTPGAPGNCGIMEPVRKERAIDSAFADSLYFAGGAFSRAVEKLAGECWKPSGLTPSQGNLLLHLLDNAHSFSVFISSDLRVNPSTVTRLADQLEAKGLVSRITYRRWTYLSTTEKAWGLLPALVGCDNAFRDRCSALLGENGPRILARSLNRATDKLTGHQLRKTE
jgi:DNA-binding MarR family transcriptional regulator